MNTAEVLRKMREKNGLADDAPVGIVSSFGAVEEVTDDRNLVLVANTDDIDLDNEVVVPSGLRGEAYFFKNRKIFADHRYDIGSVIGTLRSATPFPSPKNQRGWRIRVYVARTPLGDDTLTLAREIGIGASIGFAPVEYGKPNAEEVKVYESRGKKTPKSMVRVSDWLETSGTMMPCNVSCQGGAATFDDTKAAILDQMVCKSRIARASAVAFGLPATPVRKFHGTTDRPQPGGTRKVLRVQLT